MRTPTKADDETHRVRILHSAVKLGPNTHSWDFDARSQILEFVLRNATTLRVAAPAHGDIAPPGCYMIFIVEDGVPSVSRIIRVE